MHKQIWSVLLCTVLAVPVLAGDETPGEKAPGEEAAAAEGHWIADYDKAVEKAKAEGKDLLVDFTGSDWCGWCKKLDAEVFSHESFLTEVKKHFVLVALDFPRGEEAKAKVPNPERNKELQAKFGIRGFPTILLVTVDGDEFGRTGYQKGGPENYIKHLAEKRTEGKAKLAKVLELATAYESAADAEKKAAAFEAAFKMFSELQPGDVGQARLGAIVKAAFKSDPDNAKGIKLRATEALLKAGMYDADVAGAARSLDPKNEKGLLERCVDAQTGALSSLEDVKAVCQTIEELAAMGEFKDKELGKKLCVNTAWFYFQHLKNPEKAKEWAKRAQALGIENPRWNQVLEKILGG